MARPATSNKQPAENAVFLGKILSSFDGPLNEEQAWAVCYQSAHFLKMSWLGYDKSSGLSLVDGVDAICVHKDGSVTVNVREVQSLRGKGEENSADLTGDHIYHTESEVVNTLGRIIYHALDYGCHEEEERVLSEPLEDMIDQMTNSGEGTGLANVDDEDRKSQGSANTDEGIVDGHESDEADERNNTSYRRLSTFADVLKVCSEHLLEPEGAPMHYQAVCRALLAEAMDLTSFLQVIASSKQNLQSLHNDHQDQEDSHLEDIQPKQWARIWMQVLQQLRQVVKLKEINDTSLNQSRIPIEYELTPYEILMDDIRSRKYTLRQVLVNDDLPPRVKKEAHDVILDFIRSRPPLKPVPKGYSQPRRTQTLYERMLDDIRSKPSLAPAANRVLPERKPKLKKKKTNRNRPKMRHQSTSEGSCASSVDSEDLDIFDSPEFPRKVLRAGITLDWSDEDDAIETDATLTVTPRTDDDITPQPTCRRDQLKPFKILETLNAPSFESLLSPDSSVTPTNEEDEARLHDVDSEAGEGDNEQLPTEESPRRHSVTICQTLMDYSSHPERYVPPECLALTVDEVIHIRSVLVKAEIENLRVNPKIHTAVLKEKICFSCKKKFALFKRKSRCKLCKRLICTICTKQMFLPRGHFLQIPIESLSPISPKRGPCFGGHQPSQMYKSHSEPPTPSISPQGSPRLWRREKQTNRPKEQLDKVCCECKDFLKEAVRASREASYINGSGHRESNDFRLNSPPRLPKQSSRDSERSDRSTRSTASNRSRRSNGDLRRQGSRHSDIECDAPSTQGDEHD